MQRRSTRPIHLRAPDEPRPRRDVAPPFKKLVGGWLCLDFVNTVSAWIPASAGGPHGRDDRPLGELLTSYEALLRWSEQAGAMNASDLSALEDAAASRPDEAAAVLVRGLRLRGALYQVFGARLASRRIPQEALDVVDGELARLRRGEHLVENDDETLALGWRGGAGEMDALLWPVVRSAIGLLESRPMLERLRQCDGERCGWLFVDVSRGGRRRWCDMADCGNVAKVRAHRAKKTSRGK